ncbi:hypothetical protein KGF56_001164 [Candida oxycetoniae]|uniref:Uncharacterized protein n=1 Tax=Candida oxycetoniae TaxID=497107 RepID=A0AAI9T022_9ASCO|nr:uncharacterized protein KGF56_001164 [Candida oxycetoniae]KAI3405945.2 hypothetical protein KGF56_001164 [Candida oxycetoniae]
MDRVHGRTKSVESEDMPPFRPYGGDEIRVVSDLSRFHFQEGNSVRSRSRNTTPTNTDVSDTQSSGKLTLDTIIPLYSSKIDDRNRYKPLGTKCQEEEKEALMVMVTEEEEDAKRKKKDEPIVAEKKRYEHIVPEKKRDVSIVVEKKRDVSIVPEKKKDEPIVTEKLLSLPKTRRLIRKRVSVGVQVPQDHIPPRSPTPPPKDDLPKDGLPKDGLPKDGLPKSLDKQNEFSPYPISVTDLQQVDQLPPLPQPTEDLFSQENQIETEKESSSMSSRQKQLEHDLVKRVMNRPLVSIKTDRFGDKYRGKRITITVNFVLYIFEQCCSIVGIVLASVLLKHDSFVPDSIYRYFLADGCISLIVSLLFAFQIVNYEKRNGSFYCLAATIIKFVSFIMVVSYLFPLAYYQTQQIWSMRRAIGAFIIISTFLWLVNLTMFLTTLFISRLNLLEELNFDYDYKGLDDQFNRKPQGYTIENEPLREFFLNENGEMYALNEDWEKEQYKNNNKILVYTY